MSDIELIDSNRLGRPVGHYSHAVSVGGLLFLSGQLPITPEGRKLTGEPFETQTRQVLDNLTEVLAACGCRPDDLIQVRVYLCNIDCWPSFNRLYAAWLGDHRPARCVVPTPVLHYNLDLEVEAVARISANGPAEPRSVP